MPDLWHHLIAEVTLDTGQLPGADAGFALSFPSDPLLVDSGGSTVRVTVGVQDFPAILAAMCEVDRERALAAMSAELAKQL